MGRLSIMDTPAVRLTCIIEKPASLKRVRNSDSVRSRPLVKTIINMSITFQALPWLAPSWEGTVG